MTRVYCLRPQPLKASGHVFLYAVTAARRCWPWPKGDAICLGAVWDSTTGAYPQILLRFLSLMSVEWAFPGITAELVHAASL